MISEYLLDETEIDTLVAMVGAVDKKEFKKLFESIAQSAEQEETIRAFLLPMFDDVVSKRPEFLLPSAETIVDAMVVLAGEGTDSKEL